MGHGRRCAFCVQVWTYGGTGVSMRDALVPDMNREWETPGFSKTVSTVAKGKTKAPKKGKKGSGARKK